MKKFLYIVFLLMNSDLLPAQKMLVAFTMDKHHEVGVPVCYVDERGDTIVPYGKYKFCQTDTIRNIGFVYENKKDARIVCIDNQGKELFYVFKYDNGPDYIREGLFRIMDENGWIGFADSLGNVVIKPQFKFATPFENGKAQATTSGRANDDGEHSFWLSDEWELVGHNGTKMMKYTVVRDGMDLKGLQITLFNKQGKYLIPILQTLSLPTTSMFGLIYKMLILTVRMIYLSTLVFMAIR